MKKDAAALLFLTMATCSRGGIGHFTDRRLDEETWFVFQIHRVGPPATAAAGKSRLPCHLAKLTLDSGYRSFSPVTTVQYPGVDVGKDETVEMATIRMFKEEPGPGDRDRVDAKLLRQTCRD